MHPSLLVGLENRDDAGVFALSETQALVQTVDFFTPIVDDPYHYGQIAAANALSDVYAMGGRPISVLNIACFDPAAAPPEVWANVLKGAYDKTIEAGAVVLGGHSVEDQQPKFGMAVTGIVDPSRMFVNTNAEIGDRIFLSKPLGTGIITTAAKRDMVTEEELATAVASMSTLNARAAELGLEAGVRCATDITGFSLVGHLYNVARASHVTIELDAASLPLLPGVERLVVAGCITGGSYKNRDFLGDAFKSSDRVPDWMIHLAFDPQTSGGLALFSKGAIKGYTEIGRVTGNMPGIALV